MLVETPMLKSLLRIGHGVKRRDSEYFTNASGATHRNRFREDIRAVVGGALAAAFVAAAFTNLVPNSLISDGAMTVAAALAGGIGSKLFLV
jgi:hypothetical protein